MQRRSPASPPFSTPCQAEDAELLEQIKRGKAEEMGVVYRRHAAVMFAIARTILRSPEEAEDVVHEIFVKLFDRAGQFKAKSGTVRSWLAGAVRNACIDRVRREKRTRRIRDMQLGCFARNPRSTEPVAPTLIDARACAVRLRALPTYQRETLEEMYANDLSCSEIAVKHGVPLGTVKSRMARGLGAIREDLGLDGPPAPFVPAATAA